MLMLSIQTTKYYIKIDLFLKWKQLIHSVHNIDYIDKMVCMSIQLTQLNYNVDFNTKYSNYIEL